MYSKQSTENSKALFARAKEVLPGGVNSPVRAFAAVGGEPRFIERAKGAWLYDVDGNEYVDFVGSWGPMILGHADEQVAAAVKTALDGGSSFGAPTPREVEMAELIRELVPTMQVSRMVSSGTEAVMGALRVARGFTKRSLVVKFDGNYHGGADYLLVKAGSGAATLGVPDSAGIPSEIASTTLVADYNSLDSVNALFAARGQEIAAVIVEPVVGNMGCVPPAPGFLEGLRAITKQHGALLVFDEVMTGFRVALGGAQAKYKIEPDLTCLGKIVGGGLPAGAYGGRKEIMSFVAPAGPVYQAGTLSGNPLAVSAGLTTLKKLCTPGVYEDLEAKSRAVESALVEGAAAAKQTVCVQRVGSMLTPFFQAGPVRNWADADKSDRAKFKAWHGALLENGVYWPPSQFEAGFVSLAHDAKALEKTKKAFAAAFKAIP
jgi:glutamate-1-semialdehyde 2,1-aminomutase